MSVAPTHRRKDGAMLRLTLDVMLARTDLRPRQAPTAVKTTERKDELEQEQAETDKIICPVCGAQCVQRRCKVICESERCQGRIVLNCSEF